jgi:D-alanyl-lipoteichoic acid acyltransferase DltB (MBOAT superfamily)
MRIVDPVFAAPNAHTAIEAWLAMYAYAIQIYADFSGYTDIAIGCALLLGIRFPQNFDSPYRALSLQEFWRRWHMTLSRWLRDYLYIGVGGSRGSRLFTARNIMITMILGGLWHGAAWTFMLWGAIHGAAQVVERELRRFNLGRTVPKVAGVVIAWTLTFQVVCFAWVFFRAESFDFARDMFVRMVTGGWGGELVAPMVVLAIVAPLLWQLWPRGWDPQLRASFGRLAAPAQIAVLACGIVIIDALGPEGVAPFIYFQF